MTRQKLIEIRKQTQRRKRLAGIPAAFRNGFFTKVLLLTVFLLFSAQLGLSLQLSTQGSRIKKLEEQLASLAKDGSRLRGQISDLSSLNRVRSEAQSRLLMLESAGRIEYITPQELASK